MRVICLAKQSNLSGVPFPPGRPKVVAVDASSATIAWEAPIDSGSGGPVAGYQIEYRPANTQDWLFANDHIVTETSFKGIDVYQGFEKAEIIEDSF